MKQTLFLPSFGVCESGFNVLANVLISLDVFKQRLACLKW